MIKELVDFITTPGPFSARYDSIALLHRAHRCKKFWAEHLQCCHNQMHQLAAADSIAIFGSGLLLETPIEMLENKFNKIFLFDLIHPKSVLTRYKSHAKIIFKYANLITDSVNEKFDTAISANLLSQLPRRNSAQMLEIQEHHLGMLKQVASKNLLISDFQINMTDRTGDIQRTYSLHPEIKIPWHAKWKWKLAPAPEISKNISISLDVGAAWL